MWVEHAVYSRVEVDGLKIVLTSSRDNSFLDIAGSIGAHFVPEEWSGQNQETSEFVYYDERKAKRFLGVSVNPSAGSGIENTNMLVQIFLPEEASNSPRDYYLPYPCRRVPRKGEELTRLELSPDLPEDPGRVIRQYGWDRQKLGELIWKGMPLLLEGVRNYQLCVILEDGRYGREELSFLAREITGLFCGLNPRDHRISAPGGGLSYALLSTRNTREFPLAYVTEALYGESEDLRGRTRIYLDRPCEEEVPEMYLWMAEKLLASREAYLDFLDEWKEAGISKEFTVQNLEMMFFCWKFQRGLARRTAEIPISIGGEFVDIWARGSQEYRVLLYQCLNRLEGWERKDLEKIWKQIMLPTFDQPREEDEDSFLPAVKTVIRLLSQGETGEKPGFRTLIRILPGEIRRQLLREFAEETPSLIREDLENIRTAADCMEAISLYGCLLGEDEEIDCRLQEIAGESYFALDHSSRQQLSRCFQGNARSWDSWNRRLAGLIRENLESCSFPELLRMDLGDMETGHKQVWCEEVEKRLRENCVIDSRDIERMNECLELLADVPREACNLVAELQEQLEQLILARADGRDLAQACIWYLELERRGEDLWNEQGGLSGPGRWRLYKRWKEKKLPLWEKLVGVFRQENLSFPAGSEGAARRARELILFDQLDGLQEEISVRNVGKASRLLEQAVELFGEDTEPLRALQKKCREVRESRDYEMYLLRENHKREIRSVNEQCIAEIERLRKEIRSLQERVSALERALGQTGGAGRKPYGKVEELPPAVKPYIGHIEQAGGRANRSELIMPKNRDYDA